MRRLVIGEDVLAKDGARLGQVDRLVVDEGAHEVTHIVVADRAVPLSHFRDAGPDGLATDLPDDGLGRFPLHDEAELEPPGENWRPPGGYLLQNFVALTGSLIGGGPYTPPVHASLVPGQAPSEIIEGSPVWADERRVGEVVEVYTDDRGHTAGFVLERERRRYKLPIHKVVEVVGPNVHVELSETDVELLEPYEEAGEGKS